MNNPRKETIEEQKLSLESKKLVIETMKLELTKNGFYIDIFSKIALPLALTGLA